MNGSSSRSSYSLGGLITLKYFETRITYKLIKELPKVLVILAPAWPHNGSPAYQVLVGSFYRCLKVATHALNIADSHSGYNG